ncbi:MAG: hypothetical protein AAF386_06845 [Pseudomonadota bacterium]
MRGVVQYSLGMVAAYLGHVLATVGFGWLLIVGILGASWWAGLGVPLIVLGFYAMDRFDR